VDDESTVSAMMRNVTSCFARLHPTAVHILKSAVNSKLLGVVATPSKSILPPTAALASFVFAVRCHSHGVVGISASSSLNNGNRSHV
jgi:hypothetical protein